jgi:soluble lytic murein transglycosylase-like protein
MKPCIPEGTLRLSRPQRSVTRLLMILALLSVVGWGGASAQAAPVATPILGSVDRAIPLSDEADAPVDAGVIQLSPVMPLAELAAVQDSATEVATDFAATYEDSSTPAANPVLMRLYRFITSYNKAIGASEAALIAQAMMEYGNYYGVDARLLLGVAAVESSFRRNAISSAGAIGLGQLKPATAQWLGVANPYDPVQNIGGMARYLNYLIRRYQGDLDAAISAYFQGQGFVDKNGITDKCKDYLYRVNAILHRYHQTTF